MSEVVEQVATGGKALLSPCGTWRYRLDRDVPGSLLDGVGGPVLFAMLNPSTADAGRDDWTITRLRRVAHDIGATGLTVVNLYAYRATDPDALHAVAERERIGPHTDAVLIAAASEVIDRGGVIVCAWGARPHRLDRTEHGRRVTHVTALLAGVATGHGLPLYALDTTADGQPRHPRGIPADARLKPWP